MNEVELQKILDNHRLWLEGEGGKCANLSCAGLSCAELTHADLRFANLRYADLSHADLTHADLTHADLGYADLTHADLTHADLSGVVYNERTAFFALQCPEEGAFIGWKKCRDGVIVKLLIPEDAKRSSATSRKCRASKAVVLEVIGAETAISEYDFNCVYEKGKTLVVDCFDDNRWNECSSGIHFFLTRKEAENYKF